MSLNDELWDFPHSMTLKVFGDAGEEPLADIVGAILARHLHDFAAHAVTTRASSHGRFLAVSADITVHNREQVLGIYADLRAHPRIRMAI